MIGTKVSFSLGIKEYIDGGGFKEDVPNLEQLIVQKGVAHFNNHEATEDINNYIHDFIKIDVHNNFLLMS